MTEILPHAKVSILDTLRGDFVQLFLSQDPVTEMRHNSRGIRGPLDGTNHLAERGTDMKDNSVSTSLDTIETT